MQPSQREAIRLYRDIIRTCRRFTWVNEKGEPWRYVLQANARKEFEEARYEKDPLLIARMLVVGRDSLMKLQEQLDAAEAKLVEHIDKTRPRS